MPTVTELIRKRLEAKPLRPNFHELQLTQWDKLFEQACKNRLIVGAHRYETFEEKKLGHSYNIIPYIQSKLDDYKTTGNTENLCDIANLCMIEFVSPSHPKPVWEPVDDKHHVPKK